MIRVSYQYYFKTFVTKIHFVAEPMTSIPSLAPFRKPNAPSVPARSFKKNSAIQMLDIGEQPLGRDAKRKKIKEDKEKEDKDKEVESTTTPDYAAGLTSMIPPSPAPVYAPATPQVPSSHEIGLAPRKPVINAPQHKQEPPPSLIQPTLQPNVNQQLPQPRLNMPINQGQPQLTPAPQIQQRPQLQPAVQPPRMTPQAMLQQPMLQQPVQPVVQQPQQRQFIQQPQQQVGQQFVIGTERKPVNVTPELRAAVAEVFRGANRATKPEKALIVGFICGSKENPCPQLGHIVTIKLGDHIEKVTYPDGSETYSFVEMHYQMNYQTGEGKKIKKPRPLTQQEIQQLHMQQQQMQQQQQQQAV